MTALYCLFGPGALPESVAAALVDITDAEVSLRHGTWGWSARATVEDPGPDQPEVSAHRREQIAALARRAGCDHAVITGPLATRAPRLLVLDVDSTLTGTEAIDLLADEAGVGPEVAAVTERAMRGELDFAASLTERVATLAGLPLQSLESALERVTLSPGASELGAWARSHDIPLALVSGGFTHFVQPLTLQFPVAFWAANTLEVAEGRLTGRVLGQVVDRAAKAEHLRDWAVELGIEPARVVAIGDGANDLDMLAAAGLGVAYCAKPVTARQADVAITFPRLDAVCALLTTERLP